MPLKRARLRISDYNTRRKSDLKKHERRIRGVSLSLTSMVDMFAILVIFLLTNTSTVAQWIEVGNGIELPRAKFSDSPPKAATIQVSRDAIYTEGKKLGGLESAGAVKTYLQGIPKKDGYVNLVAHNRLPFGVVRKIVTACQDAGYKTVNLAVQPKGGG